jgi:hypothetical protein
MWEGAGATIVAGDSAAGLGPTSILPQRQNGSALGFDVAKRAARTVLCLRHPEFFGSDHQKKKSAYYAEAVEFDSKTAAFVPLGLFFV